MREWIENKGKEMTGTGEKLVEVKKRDGRKFFRVKALLLIWKPSKLSKFDIVEYRISEEKES